MTAVARSSDGYIDASVRARHDEEGLCQALPPTAHIHQARPSLDAARERVAGLGVKPSGPQLFERPLDGRIRRPHPRRKASEEAVVTSEPWERRSLGPGRLHVNKLAPAIDAVQPLPRTWLARRMGWRESRS